MKRIYTITLDDDDIPLSHNIGSDIREIAYWIYEELSKFDEQILCIDIDQDKSKDGLLKNELYDIPSKEGYIYKFDSDLKDIDNRIFEPFVLDDKTFGFTIYDGRLTDGEISIILDGILKLLKMNYKYTIDSVVYDDKSMKNRFNAIDKLMNKKDVNNSKKRVKVPAKMLATLLNIW